MRTVSVARGWRALLAILSWLALASGALAGLAPAHDLAADGEAMRARGLVMLVLFSQEECHWCERTRREILLPLQHAATAQQRVLLREIAIDADTVLTDFAGRKTSHRRFARGEGVRMTPTLIVYGPDGKRLAEPIVGFRLADFYAEYVDRAIAEGHARLAAPYRGD
jgi:thioredoxin-related protein